ncbi:hypothetical protein OBBRIDRAFT_839870 [Obba rivulosa]|uniref:F-box domain-containing protein n=1 Tax=Obba rivulosa TaxID=1052685 RepID=A0A8E2AGT4_9APHY|nr:hypothetical protein OBBRIDRAFT_839870 [Obba rivulosa]
MFTTIEPRLPPELLYLILDTIDDPRTLLAFACTCRIFHERVEQIRFKRRGPNTFTDLDRLRMQLKEDPLIKYFFLRARCRAADLNKLACEFAGKLLGLKAIVLDGEDLTRPKPTRQPTFAALSHFKSVTELVLYRLDFWSFRDFAHLLCALDNLNTVRTTDISWQRDGRDLEDEPFAASLHLRSITIFDHDNLARHVSWLSAPKLRHSLSALTLQTSERLLSQWLDDGRDRFLASLANIETLVFSFTGEDISPTPILPIFLSKMPENCISYIAISYSVVDGSLPQQSSRNEECKSSFGVLDAMLTSPRFPCLTKVSVDVNGHPNDSTIMGVTELLLFPRLASRGILDQQVSTL